MTDYSIIATEQRDIVLEYGNVKIPIKELSYTKQRFCDNYGYCGPAMHFLDIETYKVLGRDLITVLDNITKAKLTVNSVGMNMVQEPILVFDHMVPIPHALSENRYCIDDDEKLSLRFYLEAGNRYPN